MLEQANIHLQSNEFHKAFLTFRAAERTWELLPIMEEELISYHEASKMVFDANPNDAEALFVILRYQMINDFNPLESLEIAKKCVFLDPKVADFHHWVGSLEGSLADYDSSVRCFERALELDPNPEWLYDIATSLRLQSERNPAKVIKAYEDFISANEPDSRKVPEAYYCIGLEYQMMNNEKKAEEFLKKAIESESPPLRLSFLALAPLRKAFLQKIFRRNLKC
jgi:tetratricopeptide (TPR) repeat protein